MYCLIVSLNGQHICSAAIEGATLVSAIVSASLLDEGPAGFHVSGMMDLGDNRSAHVYWVEETPIKYGDSLLFSVADQSSASKPLSIVPLDSPEYIEEQSQFAEFREAHVWPHPGLAQRRRNAALNLSAPNYPTIRAGIGTGHQHILCTLLWDMWSPERTKVFARSFGGDLQSLDWLRTNLRLGDEFRIDVPSGMTT